jgi:hypothetical protein
MQGCSDAEAQDWREWVKEVAPWASCLDPCRRNYKDSESMPWWVVKEIVQLDKIDIVQSDVLLANMLPDKSKTGSNMEILYAFERGKLVVIVLPEDKPISPWHRYHAHQIVHDLEAALAYIKEGNYRIEKVAA